MCIRQRPKDRIQEHAVTLRSTAFHFLIQFFQGSPSEIPSGSDADLQEPPLACGSEVQQFFDGSIVIGGHHTNYTDNRKERHSDALK